MHGGSIFVTMHKGFLMAELTLLERIQALEEKKNTTGKTPVEIETRSILVHLNKLLNTNKGSTRIDLELGMPNMSDYSSDGITVMMEKMTKSIVMLVSRFEKRLSKVKVKMESDKSNVLSIHFSLEGNLSRHGDVPVLFKATIKPGGRIIITQ